MGWLEDLIGPSPDDNSGFENWLAPTDLFNPSQFMQDYSALMQDQTPIHPMDALRDAIQPTLYPMLNQVNPLQMIPRAARALNVEMPNHGFQQAAEFTQPFADLPAQMLSDPSQAALLPLFFNPVTSIPTAAYFMNEMSQGGGEEIGKGLAAQDNRESPWGHYGAGLAQLGMAGLAGFGGAHETARLGKVNVESSPAQYDSPKVLPPNGILGDQVGAVDNPFKAWAKANQEGRLTIDPALANSVKQEIMNTYANDPETMNGLLAEVDSRIGQSKNPTPPPPGQVTMANTGYGTAEHIPFRDAVETADLANRQSEIFSDQPNPFAVEEAKTKGIFGNQKGMVRNPFNPEDDKNIVFHGSPYNFEQFDMSKMGTGEGNQAYGPGMYFAENPDIAGDYQRKLSNQPQSGQVIAQNYIDKYNGDVLQAIAGIKALHDPSEPLLPEFKDAIKHLEEGTYSKGPDKGNLYASEIPQPEHFLDYDKRILDQPDIVKNAIPDVVSKIQRYEPDLIKAVHDVEATVRAMPIKSQEDMSVNTAMLQAIKDFHDYKPDAANELSNRFYDYNLALENSGYHPEQKIVARGILSNLRNELHAPSARTSAGNLIIGDSLESARNLQKIKRTGVKGVKYLDAASRNNAYLKTQIDWLKKNKLPLPEEAKLTHNYVVFDPKDINIIDKAKEPDTAGLAKHVQEMKSKYGPRAWRNKMTDAEALRFDELMNGIQKNIPLPEESGIVVPEDIPKTTPIEKALTTRSITPEVFPSYKSPQIVGTTPLMDRIKELRLQTGMGLKEARDIVVAESEKKIIDIKAEPPYIPPSIKPPIAGGAKSQGPIHVNPPTPPIARGTKSQGNPNAPDILNPVSKTARALLSAEEIVERANPNISAKEKAFRLEKETEGSISYTIVEIARREANKISKTAEERISEYTAGRNLVLSPAEKTIADTLTKELQSRGINSGQMQEAFNQAKRYDFGVIKQKFFDVTEASAEKTHLSDLKYDIANKGDVNARQTKQYLDTYLRNIKGHLPEEGAFGKASATARKIAALGDLKQSAISQLSQFAPTATTMGLRRAIRAIPEILKHYEKNELKAMSDGSLWPTIAHETARAMESESYMHGVAKSDKMMRVHANIAARWFAEDALRGGKAELAKAKELGISPKDPRFVDKMAKALVDETQFRTDVSHVPQWTKTTYGKIPTQYMSFGYRHAAYIIDLMKHPWKNRGEGIGRIAKFAAIGVATGEGIGSAKAILNSIFPGKGEDDKIINRMIEGFLGDPEFDYKPLAEKLQAVTQSKRIPLSSLGFRALQNLANIGGAGIFQSVLERVFDPHKSLAEKSLSVVSGPVGTHLYEGGKAIAKDINRYQKYDIKNPVNFERFLIQRNPYAIPGISGYRLGNAVLPPDEYRMRGKSSFGTIKAPKF